MGKKEKREERMRMEERMKFKKKWEGMRKRGMGRI